MVAQPCEYEGNPKACIAIRRTGPPARCMSNGGCKAGRANEEKARHGGAPSGGAPWKDLGEEEKKKAKERYAAIYGTKAPADETKPVPREINRAERETIQQKKEEVDVSIEGAKERILARVLRELKCSRGRLANYCGVDKATMDAATRELEKEGKIKSWPNGRAGIYTPPGAPDPWATGEKKTATAAATAKVAAPRAIAPAIAPARKSAGNKPPKNGGGRTGSSDGAIAAVIADLEARRQNIDNAIAVLKSIN